MKLREIEVGRQYAVTVPRQRELASDAERRIADENMWAGVKLERSDLLYHFPSGQHPTYGFRARVLAKSLPCGKTDLGVMIEFTYRTGFRDDAPERTDTRVIHASRVLAPWADFETAQLARSLDFLDKHPYSRYGCNFPGCREVYEHPRILGPLGYVWYCPDHQPAEPIREEDAW